jgi:uncharacterized membrane protein (UPF0182 family)
MLISKDLGQLRVKLPEQAATPATVTPIEPTPSTLTSNAKKRKAAIEIADEKAGKFAAIRQKLQKLDTRIKASHCWKLPTCHTLTPNLVRRAGCLSLHS